MRTLPHDEIVLLASNNFSDWIEESKRLLFEVCPSTQHNVKHNGTQTDVNNIKDCLKLLHECGENIPRFVSHYLDDLPTVGFGNMDTSALLSREERWRQEVSTLTGALEAQASVSENLGVATAALDRRVLDIEKLRGSPGWDSGAGATSASQERELQVPPAGPSHQSPGVVVSSKPLSPAWNTVLKEGKHKPQKPLKLAVQPKPGGTQARLKRE